MTDDDLTLEYLELKADGKDADSIRLEEVRNELEGQRGCPLDEEIAA
jgi:hypothetical protein